MYLRITKIIIKNIIVLICIIWDENMTKDKVFHEKNK